jgi:hypothetical protein
MRTIDPPRLKYTSGKPIGKEHGKKNYAFRQLLLKEIQSVKEQHQEGYKEIYLRRMAFDRFAREITSPRQICNRTVTTPGQKTADTGKRLM